MKLQNNTILITGGTAGIGLAFAKKFHALGNKIIVTGRSESKFAAVQEAIPDATVIQSDIAAPEQIKALGEKIRSDHKDVNVLMNNAGIFDFQNVRKAPDDLAHLTREIDTNIKGPINLISQLVNQICDNNGTIINVTSGLAWVPIQCAPTYCATKAAMHSYTISLRFQLAGSAEVIEIAPPAVSTDLTSDIPPDGDFKIITTEQLITESFKALAQGKTEICPGQAAQLRFMSRMAPGFIQGQLAKGSKDLIPV